jgi:hypothetical protein
MCGEAVALDVEDFMKALNELGKAICLILDFLPSKELSVPISVKDGCTLVLSLKKSS